MPAVSRPFTKGGIVMLLNYNDHEPPHLHAKYQNDFGSYRIEIRTRVWMKSDKKLSAVSKDGGSLGTNIRTRSTGAMGQRETRTPRAYRGLNPWKAWQERAQDEAHWRNHIERGLLKAEYVRDFVLRLWFEDELDVEIYELDFAPMLIAHNPGGVFTSLKNKENFRRVRGDYALIWLNPETNAYDESAIDLAPECVRFFCEVYGKQIKAPNGNLSS